MDDVLKAKDVLLWQPAFEYNTNLNCSRLNDIKQDKLHSNLHPIYICTAF